MFIETLGGFAIRSVVLLAATLLAASLLRRRSASLLHCVWTLGLLASVLIPLVSRVTPTLRLAVLPSRHVHSEQQRQNAVTSEQEPDAVHQTAADSGLPAALPPVAAVKPRFAKNSMRDGTAVNHASLEHVGATSPDGTNDTVGRSPGLRSHDRSAVIGSTPEPKWRFAQFVCIVWLAVAGCLVARWIVQWFQVRQMLSNCKSLDNDRLNTIIQQACVLLDVESRPRLLSSSDVQSPMIAGVFKTWLVLPEAATDWSAERLRMVLIHELAHIARHDILTQSLAGLACAVNWFNPLAWYAARQMRNLREIACDDLVVMRCRKPADYAETLMEVARACRRPALAMTVTMARSNAITRRILAIVDASRERSSLSRRATLCMAGVSIAVTGMFSIVQLTASAQPPAESSQEQATEITSAQADQAPELRSMRVRIVDADGEPINDASVFVNIIDLDRSDKFPNKSYQSNPQGEVDFRLPSKVGLLRIWPSKPGYVPQFLNFGDANQNVIKGIPGSYTFFMQRGVRLGGTVVDENNQPIAGASVQVKVEVSQPLEASKPEPIISTWLASGDDAVITDQEGRWEILNAPAKREGRDFEFRLQVTHPEFAGDTFWGELQLQQGVTTKQLRSKTAKIKLGPGLRIHGKITGPSGELVTDGLVVWDDRPYWAVGTNEVAIDESGNYKSLPLGPGEYPVTVLAPGFAPQQFKFQLDASSKSLDFQLKLGHPITLEIVDQAGEPVPDAYVGIGQWRGTEAIYNEKHSNVPDSGIPRRSDGQGNYRWGWAPEDVVVYRIGKKGYVQTKVALVARDEPHRIELAPMMKIFGKVTDEVTGQPIENFSVVPVKAFRPDFYSTSFQDRAPATGGDYELTINSYGQTGNRYRVRVEAEGYRTALSTKSMEVGDPPLQEDFQLEPAPAVQANVFEPNGEPAVQFMVAVGTPTSAPQFNIERPDAAFGIAFEVAGMSQFELPATFEPQLIRVFNDAGFAEVALTPDEPLGQIQLQPWAMVSGRLMQGDKPIGNENVYFHPLGGRGLTQARFQDSFYTRTDLEGRFQFDRLPPMLGSVGAHLGPWEASPMSSSQSVVVDLKPGQTTNLVLGGEGSRLIGKVVATGRSNDDLSKQWSLNYLISREPGVPLPPEFDSLAITPDQVVDTSVLENQDFSTWLGTKMYYFVKLSDEGTLQVDGVPPGQYDLVIRLYEQPAGCLIETIGQKIIPVPIQTSSETPMIQNLGEISVECRRGPRVGSDMRAYRFVDVNGRQQSINDATGQYVLMHVWASWCVPCIEAMPNMKAAITGYAGQPLTVVGLNIDDVANQSTAKAMAKDGQWDWAMNYLGSDSDTMRELAVSSVPAYYLIGPDGKLITSSNQWTEVKKSLEAEFSQ